MLRSGAPTSTSRSCSSKASEAGKPWAQRGRSTSVDAASASTSARVHGIGSQTAGEPRGDLIAVVRGRRGLRLSRTALPRERRRSPRSTPDGRAARAGGRTAHRVDHTPRPQREHAARGLERTEVEEAAEAASSGEPRLRQRVHERDGVETAPAPRAPVSPHRAREPRDGGPDGAQHGIASGAARAAAARVRRSGRPGSAKTRSSAT